MVLRRKRKGREREEFKGAFLCKGTFLLISKCNGTLDSLIVYQNLKATRALAESGFCYHGMLDSLIVYQN